MLCSGFFFSPDCLSWLKQTEACLGQCCCLRIDWCLDISPVSTANNTPPLMANNQNSVGVSSITFVPNFFSFFLLIWCCRCFYPIMLCILSAASFRCPPSSVRVEDVGFCTAVKSHFIQPESYDETSVGVYLLMEWDMSYFDNLDWRCSLADTERLRSQSA